MGASSENAESWKRLKLSTRQFQRAEETNEFHDLALPVVKDTLRPRNTSAEVLAKEEEEGDGKPQLSGLLFATERQQQQQQRRKSLCKQPPAQLTYITARKATTAGTITVKQTASSGIIITSSSHAAKESSSSERYHCTFGTTAIVLQGQQGTSAQVVSFTIQ